MQGIRQFIATDDKVEYLNRLLRVGFDTLDFGSFVSPKAIPQMADTAEVLARLELDGTRTRLLAIVGNARGAEDACAHESITFLGFPFSISETFQRRNLNSSITDSLERIEEIQALCTKHDKQLVVYISMGFGNPYKEPWDADIVGRWAERLANMGIGIIALADTIGVANPKSITYLFSHLIPAFPQVEFGAHFHTTPDAWLEKIDAAHKAGLHAVRRCDHGLRWMPDGGRRPDGQHGHGEYPAVLREPGRGSGARQGGASRRFPPGDADHAGRRLPAGQLADQLSVTAASAARPEEQTSDPNDRRAFLQARSPNPRTCPSTARRNR